MRIKTACRLLIPSVTALMLAFPAASLAAAPANDNFANATPVGLNDEPAASVQTNVDATVETNEPLTPAGGFYCNGADSDPTTGVKMTGTVWYLVTGDGHRVTLDTRGSAIDTVMAVYDADSGDFMQCNDDISSGASGDVRSELTFQSARDHDYLVQIGACSASNCTPNAQGHISFHPFSAPPNDTRAAATQLVNGRPSTARPSHGRCGSATPSRATARPSSRRAATSTPC